MRAYAIDAFGETGTVRELPDPVPAEDEVLVRVEASGLNGTDVAVIAGFMKDYLEHRFPLVPGIDVSGVVERVGPGVAGYREGDEVFGYVRRPVMGLGTLAELVALPVAGVLPKPSSLRHEEAAVIAHSGLTAAAAVNAAEIRPGDRVVMLGATGGVGSYASQLVTRAGASLTAVTWGDYADYARSLGAVEVIEYDLRDAVEIVNQQRPDGIDVLLDFAGAAELLMGLSAHVRSGGRVVSVVIPPDTEGLSARGVKGTLATRYEAEHQFPELVRALVERDLRLPAIQSFSFDDVADAIALQSTRHVQGKLAVVMGLRAAQEAERAHPVAV